MSRPSRSKYQGKDGQRIDVYTNSFPVTSLPRNDVYHYDVDFDIKLDRRRKLEIIDKLQIQHPQLFNPRASYDGERNMFRSKPLDLPNNSATLTVYRGNVEQAIRRNASGVKVTIKQVAKINPSCLQAVVNGTGRIQSQELSSLALLNIIIRMKPIMTYPSNSRSFFTPNGRNSNIGQGLELWRGYFQSVRLSIDRLLVNVDIATAVMYRGGSLLEVIKSFLNVRNVNELAANRISQASVRSLNRFLKGLLVHSIVPRSGPGVSPKTRPIREIVTTGADEYQFEKEDQRNGHAETMTISEYFRRTYNYSVTFGKIICVGFGKGIVYPLEVLEVKEGQFYKKRLSPSLTSAVLTFSTQKPRSRLDDIKRAGPILGYHDSDYMVNAGLTVDTRQALLVPGRILQAPSLQYQGANTAPNGGSWNVLGRRLHDPKNIRSWGFIIFTGNRPSVGDVQRFASAFQTACLELGMAFPREQPPIIMGHPQGDIRSQLDNAGDQANQLFKTKPLLFVVVPDSAADIIATVKNWGDCLRGCPTQCVKGSKIISAKNQYHNNVALKVNIRMGGVNWVPSASLQVMRWFSEAPTMIVGADVGHAGAGSNKPSVSGLVSSVDEQMSRYVASTAVQESRLELISDLDWMLENALVNFNGYQKFMGHGNLYPQRILFYRDGLSDGQFEVIAREEIKIILNVLSKRGINAKLVYIVVGKRHHVRFFPQDERQGDRSGNCPAGLVVDQMIVHPIDKDFFLQSHGGLLGTSRSAHYTVIQDDLNMPPDAIQNISYALCHVYGRATRSVSIPAPVYYADLVCRRGKFHSKLLREGEDGSTISSENDSLDAHRAEFRPVHGSMSKSMYWI